MMAPGNYRPDGSPIIGISPHRFSGQGGITNTLDLGGGQKIQDYLAGAGVSNQGPGGGTLYTQGGDFDGTPQGIHTRPGINPRPVIDTSSQQYQDLFEKYRPGFNEEYAGKMLGTQDRTYLNLPSAQDMGALGYYDANPMTRIDKTPMMAEFMNNLYRQPASGDANLGFGSVENPLGPAGPGVGGQMGPDPSAIFGGEKIPTQRSAPDSDPFSDYNVANAYKQSDFYDDSMQSQGYLDFLQNSRDNFMRSDMQMNVKSDAYNDARGKIFDAYDTFNPITNQAEQEAFYAANPGIAALLPNERKYDDGFFADPSEPSAMPTDNFADNTDFFNNMHGSKPGFFPSTDNTTDSFGIGSNPIMNNPIAPMPNMPTAPNTQPGHSHDDLLSGIGKLFEQYFPQQGSQQINQPSPMFDAAGNSVPDGQTQSSQVFGNMITPNFGGGY